MTRDRVAVILAYALAVAVNLIIAAVLWDALRSGSDLSDNAADVLQTAVAVVAVLLGSLIGFRAGRPHIDNNHREGANNGR